MDFNQQPDRLPSRRITPMTNKIPIIIDTDPAIGYPGRDVDDGLAILAMLFDPAVEVLGLTVTFGNVSLPRALVKAKELLSRAGRSDIPVFAGAANRFDLDKKTDASEFLLHCSHQHQNQLRVLAIGPVTNVATASISYGFWQRLHSLIVLGGTLSTPQSWTHQQGFDFNLRQDLRAARRVFLGAERLTVFPMEPCRTVSLRWQKLYQMYQRGGVTAWAAKHSILWEMLSPILWRSFGFHPWDVLAAFLLTAPEVFTVQERLVLLGSRGELLSGLGSRKMKVVEEVNSLLFWQKFDQVFALH
jgi:purine nucleosidase